MVYFGGLVRRLFVLQLSFEEVLRLVVGVVGMMFLSYASLTLLKNLLNWEGEKK